MKQDYHAVLGLTSDASDDAIRAAYKRLALQWHPDRHLVGKERAAQMFIEVNQAYHALMDGKESTHSSSTETSSPTSAPPGSGADTPRSDTHPKSTQASSRPPSASSHSSKRSGTQFPESSSVPYDDGNSTNTSKSSTHSRTPPSKPSSDDLKSSSHPRPAKPSSDRNGSNSDRTKNGRKSSKSHGHLRDPPNSGAPKTAAPASTYGRSSKGTSDSIRSKSSGKTTNSSHADPEMKHTSRSETTSRNSSSRSRTSKPVIPPSSGCLHKLGFADDFVHRFSKGATRGDKEPPNSSPHDQDATPYGTPLRAINTPRGASKEWIFPLPLTLDEMYYGTSYRFLVTRELLSRRTEEVEISVDIPPGMRSGTRIVCPRTGHQRKDGALQDVVFLVEEVPDERFSRVKDDLFLDVCIPWADPLADEGGEICILGIDGKEITFTLPYPIHDNATEGQVLVKGAGMPIGDGRRTIGRGDMIVRWRVVFATHQSKWQTLKKALHLDV